MDDGLHLLRASRRQVTQKLFHRLFDVSVRFWSSLYSSYHGSGSSAPARLLTHTPMANVVSLQQIPTLRELYRRSAIAARPGTDGETRFPFSSSLLDRVSV